MNPLRFSKTSTSKIYTLSPISSIPISNDNSHINVTSDRVQEQKQVQQKKQIEKIMNGIVKERLFGNFIGEEQRISVDNYSTIQHINKERTNRRLKSLRERSLRRTIETCKNQKIKNSPMKLMKTIDMTRTGAFFNKDIKTYDLNEPRSRAYTIKMIPWKEPSQSISPTPQLGLPMLEKHLSFDRQTTTRELKGVKGPEIFHYKKLELNQKTFGDFFRKLAGIGPNQIIYDYKITRQMLYTRYKNMIDPKFLQRFFHFFGFPSQFGVRQYMSLLQNAANANLRFIYFWVFLLFDQNGNGALTHQDFFRLISQFNQNPYIESQVYMLVKWLQQSKFQLFSPGQAPFQQSLTANRNLRLEELKQMLKQTTKERIDVNCVKNTCYHQTILSLQHQYTERVKIGHLAETEEETKKLKKEMNQRKKKLQDMLQIRLRDFYTIYRAKRPKIFCFFLQLLANVNPQDYE